MSFFWVHFLIDSSILHCRLNTSPFNLELLAMTLSFPDNIVDKRLNCFHCFQLCVDIAKLTPDALQQCSQSGLLQQLVNEVHKDDILLQLNCLELLGRLACCEHGLAYLDEQGTVARLDQMLRNVNSDPMMNFLLPGN